MTKAQEIAKFVTELNYGDLPESVVEKAKEIALHAWGVQIAASTVPWSKLVYRYIRSQGGTPESTVVNYGLKTTAGNAAYINGVFGHAFEMDDNHTQTGIKGGCVTVPAALAIGEKQLSSGKDFITALVAGYEVMQRIGIAMRPGHHVRGGHPTGHCGGFGSATITSKLLGLDASQTTYALCSAGTTFNGLSEIPADGRGHIKRTFGGAAGFGGVRAALLAQAGLTTPLGTLDPAWGTYMHAVGVDETMIGKLTEGFGSVWETSNIHYKVYAQDGFIQPMTECLENIRKDHPFQWEDIDYVWIGTSKHAIDNIIGAIREPKDITDAQFSANWSVALYLVKGGVTIDEYTDENLHDSDVWDLSRRVRVEVDQEIDDEYKRSSPRGAKATVFLKSGESYSWTCPDLRAMTPSDLDEKFRFLASKVFSHDQTERLFDAVKNLDKVRDVNDIAKLLVR